MRFGVTNQSYSKAGFLTNFFSFKCTSLLNHGENRVQPQPTVTILAFITAHVFTLTEISSYGLEALFGALSSHLQGSLGHFLKGRSSGHELPQLLFIWECLDLSLTFKDVFAGYRILG